MTPKPKQATRGGLDGATTEPPAASATEGGPSRCAAVGDDEDDAVGASSAATTSHASDGVFFGRHCGGTSPAPAGAGFRPRGDAAPRTRTRTRTGPAPPPPANGAARAVPKAATAFPAAAPAPGAGSSGLLPRLVRREHGLRRRLLVAAGFVALYWVDDAGRAGDAQVPLAGRAEPSRPPAPRVCGYESREDATWVVFMGDSNMRFTYYWWTQRYVQRGLGGVEGSTYGLMRDDIGFSGKWADQEFLVPSSNNSTSVKRFSFRFLHGSINEFLYDAEHWDVARHAYPSVRDEIGLGNPAGDVTRFAASVRRQGIRIPDDRPPGRKDGGGRDDGIDWEGRVTPSDYAIWATRFQSPIADDSDEFRRWMGRWDRKDSPDVVVLTEGWLSVPRPDDLDVVRSVLMSNPRTLFVWSPIYVTGSTRERHDWYVASGVFGWELPNLRMVDLWGLARDELPRNQSHVRVGGAYMQKAMRRIWDEVGCRSGHPLMKRSMANG